MKKDFSTFIYLRNHDGKLYVGAFGMKGEEPQKSSIMKTDLIIVADVNFFTIDGQPLS